MTTTRTTTPTTTTRETTMTKNHAGTGDPHRLAPDVAKAWVEEFVLEARLADVPGDRIGDALATVQAHVVDSGETAQEAFGDPRAYARALADGMPSTRGVGTRTAASLILGFVGLLVTNEGFGGLLAGEEVALGLGHLAAAGVALLVLVALLGWSAQVLRLVADRLWVALVVPAVLVAVAVGLMVRFPEAVLEAPAVPTLVAGVVLLAVGTLLAWADHTEDRLVAPGETAPNATSYRLLSSLTMPLATLVVLALTWALHALS